jgi:nucleoside-diphosphate-sugar epimerase
MRILITGGSGYIGKFLAAQFKKDGHKVRIYDLVASELPVECVQGDLRVLEEVESACSQVDTIVHGGAIAYDSGEARKIMEVNVMGTFNLLEAAVRHNVPKVIFISSLSALGFSPFSRESLRPDYLPVDEDHPCWPASTYDLSKLLGEQLCAAYTREYGLCTICLRLSMVVDPVRPGSLVRLSKMVNVPEYGKRFLWSYVDVRDMGQAFELALMKEDVAHEVYHVSASEAAAEETTLELTQRFYPHVEIIDPDGFLENRHKALFDTSKAQEELGFQPQQSWRQSLSSLALEL